MKTSRLRWALVTGLAACSGEIIDAGSGETAAPLTIQVPKLPWAGGSGMTAPWGGSDPARWRPEAIMANAMSEALNDAWSRADVTDATVAAPVKMLDSSFREFGDGQANAAPSFEWWHQARPPVIATLIHFGSSSSKISFRFDRALPIPGGAFDVRYVVSDVPQLVRLTATKDPSGDWRAEWVVPQESLFGDPRSAATLLVHPAGWADWFPLWFRFPVRSIADLKATMPLELRKFSDGGDDADHEKVSIQATGFQGLSVRLGLMSHDFRGQYAGPYQPPSIHATFPWNGRSYVTGVGMGWTWVANQPPAPFKIMYTCFERRRQDLEASAPDGGVPSGGGWHRIGDPAETVLNDLEDAPIALGSAMSNPIQQLPSGGFAYNLSDIATVRFVHPGEAFITPVGVGNQQNYHWYFFQQDRDVCTEEWVHPFRPTETFDFAGATRTVSFQIENATTYWGQGVYVVGSMPELGNWDFHKGIQLTPTSYPTWTGEVKLPAGASVQLKFVKADGNGKVEWQGGANRTLTVNGDSSVRASW
jgi:hypothetical protein